jgi:hypothetical protein
MAENEILDTAGRAWRATRAAMANPDLTLLEVAQVAAIGLESQLSKFLRGPQTLLMFFNAAQQEPAAMRAAVHSFKDQQLARIVREAIKSSHGKDAASIAECVTEMLIDCFIDKTRYLANRIGWQTDRSEAVVNVLRQEFFTRRPVLVSLIKQSLCGEPLTKIRRTRADRDTAPVNASTLVLRPLFRPMGSGNRAPDRN